MAKSVDAHTITKPMLASVLPAGTQPMFPTLATPKVDGIRSLKQNGQLLSRSFKKIPNDRIRKALEAVLPDGADGEILAGKTFQEATSTVMSAVAKTDLPVEFYWFDYVNDGPDQPYSERMKAIKEYMSKHAKEFKKIQKESNIKVVPLLPVLIKDEAELTAFEEECLARGDEGVMVRKPDGKYKFNRSTLKEGLLLKIKRFSDAEATVVDVEEMMNNENEKTQDAFGHTKHSHHKAGMTPAGVLGALVVENKDGIRFKIGTGFDAEQRKEMWKDRAQLIGKLAKYKFFAIGVKTAPRFPVFIGFRHEDDA